MKRSIFYFILAATFFTACKKNDGPIPQKIVLDREDVQPQITKDGGSQAIDVLNLGDFSASVKIGTYTTDVPVKMDVVVRKNGQNASVKVLQAGITTFPTTITVTAAQLAALFGTAVQLNDSYDISVDYYTSETKKYEAYPIIPGNPSVFGFASGVASQPGASLSVQYKAICAYNPSLYEGNFELVTDDWADYAAGTVFELTRIDDTHFSFMPTVPENPVAIIVAVNPGDNSAKVVKQSVGTAWGYGGPGTYPAPFVLTGGSASASYVSPCDQQVVLALDYGYSAGTFGGGPYLFVLEKQ